MIMLILFKFFLVPNNVRLIWRKKKHSSKRNKWIFCYTPTVPGYHAHSGFRCKSKLLFPTRISKSCSGGLPQQPRVVIRTTRMVCGVSKSTRHHGDTSFCVSVHFCSSGFSLPILPSLAKLAGPGRVDDDWFAGFLYATFTPMSMGKLWNIISTLSFFYKFLINYTERKMKRILHPQQIHGLKCIVFAVKLN